MFFSTKYGHDRKRHACPVLLKQTANTLAAAFVLLAALFRKKRGASNGDKTRVAHKTAFVNIESGKEIVVKAGIVGAGQWWHQQRKWGGGSLPVRQERPATYAHHRSQNLMPNKRGSQATFNGDS